MNPVALRLLNQQLVSPQFSNPADVVSHLGAVQAQEYRLMRWAVMMRTRVKANHCSPMNAFKKSFDNGDIVRIHLMRGTWQLVAKEDYWWMLDLCAQKAIAVTKGWMHSNKIDIPEEEYLKIREILIQTAAENGSVTKDDFVEALAAKGITMDDHRLSYHIRMSEFTGTLCSGDLLPMKATYALSEQKVGHRPSTIDRDESLMLLAKKYFQSRQPATLEDFVWWSGLGINDCRKGIELLGDYLHVETFPETYQKQNHRDFYLTDDCRTHGFRKNQYLLIPPYDEYLIGYKSRDIVLSPKFRHKAHNNSGIFQPIIAKDGIICGNWKPFSDKFETNFFLDEHDEVEVQKAWQEYMKFKKAVL